MSSQTPNNAPVTAPSSADTLLAGWNLSTDLALSVLVMAALAVMLALCSEADAFVAGSMTMVPLCNPGGNEEAY